MLKIGNSAFYLTVHNDNQHSGILLHLHRDITPPDDYRYSVFLYDMKNSIVTQELYFVIAEVQLASGG